jgi:thiamine biosynthesis protein ThiI
VEDALNPDCVLVRYGEIALKSPRVRTRFLRSLKEAIVRAFQAQGLDCVIEEEWGRLYVFSPDLGAAARILSRVFGVVSVSPAARAPTAEFASLASKVATYSRGVLKEGQSFAIRSRRSGDHGYSSQDVAVAAGDSVRAAFGDGVRVDLSHPDVEIEVEVRGPRAFIMHERMRGVGGMPVGSQGRVLCPVRGVRDALACWMMMRRGCSAVVVVPEDAAEVQDLLDALMGWEPSIRVRNLPEGEWDWPALYRQLGRSRSQAIVVGAMGPEVPSLPPDRGEAPIAMFPLIALDEVTLRELEDFVLGRTGSWRGLGEGLTSA